MDVIQAKPEGTVDEKQNIRSAKIYAGRISFASAVGL